MFTFPQGAHVFELGCAEADWLTPMKEARPDLHLTGLDQRSVSRKGADVVILGDVMTAEIPPYSFDCIVSVSTVEHIGLGGYGDPLHEDGDAIAMERMASWIKPTGWIYFDVPYRPDGPYEVMKGKWRTYDEAQLQARLLTHWRERSRKIFTCGGDGPYIAIVAEPR